MHAVSLLLDFDDQYRRDQQQDAGFLHRRDRQLARKHDLHGRDDAGRWLALVRDKPLTDADDDPRLRAWRLLRLAFTAAGIVLGVLAMLGLLYYDGGRRISVTLIMAVAILQLILALLTSLQAWVGWRPWRALYDGPMPRWWRTSDKPEPMLRSFQAPLAAWVAQSGGLAFALAALATLLAQVLIHDLAFGWSTTLQASAPAFRDLVTALAWPWHGWLPQAVPSLQLVQASRYFHAGSTVVADPALLGNWWRFLAMLWIAYVVLPRILLLLVARLHIASRARRLLADHPGMAAWRARCDTPVVESSRHHATGEVEPVPGDTLDPHPVATVLTVIRWAGIDLPTLAPWLDMPSIAVFDAGGTASFEDDGKAAAQAVAKGKAITLIVRGWEPPTGELADFIEQVLALPAHATLELLPLPPPDFDIRRQTTVAAQWQRFVKRIGNPQLMLVGPRTMEASA